MKNSPKKGQPGRIGYLKITNIIFIVASVLICGGIFAYGYFTFKTRANLATVIAVLCLLPACKKLTNLIVILPFKDTPKEDVKKIYDVTAKISDLPFDGVAEYTDMLFSTEQHVLRFADVVMTSSKVLVYSDMSDKLNQYAKDYFEKGLAKRRFEVKFTLYTGLNDYLAVLKRLDITEEVDGELVRYMHSLMM